MSDVIQKPTTGRIVLYSLTDVDVERINSRREDAKRTRLDRTGAILHTGNQVHVGDVLPMIVVKSWEAGRINGQLFLDGNDTYWVTSADPIDRESTPYGRWFWPPRDNEIL